MNTEEKAEIKKRFNLIALVLGLQVALSTVVVVILMKLIDLVM